MPLQAEIEAPQSSPKHKTVDAAVNLAKKPVVHVRSSQILTAIFGFIGITLFSLGVQSFITNTLHISSPLVEVILGLLLLSASGLLFKKLG